MMQLALPLDPLAGLVDPLSAPHSILARRPDLAAAAQRWNRGGPTEVAGVAINDRVAFLIGVGIWRYGRVIAWEGSPGGYALANIARVAVERREPTDPHEVRRVRAGLTTVSEKA